MKHTIDSVANFLISLMALGALFLNETPWTYFGSSRKIRLPSDAHVATQQGGHVVDFTKPISFVDLDVLACVDGWYILVRQHQ